MLFSCFFSGQNSTKKDMTGVWGKNAPKCMISGRGRGKTPFSPKDPFEALSFFFSCSLFLLFLFLASCFLFLDSCFLLLVSCFLLLVAYFSLLASSFLLLLASSFLLSCFLLLVSCFSFLRACSPTCYVVLGWVECLRINTTPRTPHATRNRTRRTPLRR